MDENRGLMWSIGELPPNRQSLLLWRGPYPHNILRAQVARLADPKFERSLERTMIVSLHSDLCGARRNQQVLSRRSALAKVRLNQFTAVGSKYGEDAGQTLLLDDIELPGAACRKRYAPGALRAARELLDRGGVAV